MERALKVISLSGSSRSLGQDVGTAPLLVAVRDVNGRPLSGAFVEVIARDGTTLVSGETDRLGDALLSVPLGTGVFDLRIRAGEYVKRVPFSGEAIRRGETALVQFPICSPMPLVTPVEAGALLIGSVVTAVGFLWKEDAAKLIGEILVGSAAFTFIYRHSCL